jgi:hypothetical protein
LPVTTIERSAAQPPSAVHDRFRALNPPVLALLVWLACLPVAFEVAAYRHADPFHLRTAMIPVVIVVAGVVAMCIAARLFPAELVSGISAGLLAGWMAFTLRLALHGTPYGFDGLNGDAGRMAAMANRYSSAWGSSDGIVSTVPSHYPPLFPWLVGRAAAVVHVPAWQLLGPAEAIALSFAVVAGFALWRLLVPGPLALALTLPVLLSFTLPEKSYEILALAVFTPWAIAAFGQPPEGRRRLHWLPAGLIGGLSVVLYWAFIMYGALGIMALAVFTWRASSRRARPKFVRHVALTVVVGLVVASWYLVPYAGWALMHGSKQVDDLYQGGGISASPLPFLAMTPLAILELIGLAGMVWWRGRVWWGKPLLLLTGSAYAYWLIWLALFSLSGHTGLMQDTPRMVEPLLASAGILTIVKVGQDVIRHVAVATVPAGLPTVAVCILVLWTAVVSWQAWMPGGPAPTTGLSMPAVNTSPNEATAAFVTALPDGKYPAYGPVRLRHAWFPVDPIKADVDSVLGHAATPVTLSASEELFAFVNWPGYIADSFTAAGANTDWPARYAALHQLSRVTDPAAFGAASAHTQFGPIDVFILQADSGRWVWQPNDSPYPALSFSPAQFSPSTFKIFTGLPEHMVVAVRWPPQQG